MEVLEEKIQVLEDKLDFLQARCRILEEENEKLKESCTNDTENDVYDSYDESITSPPEAGKKRGESKRVSLYYLQFNIRFCRIVEYSCKETHGPEV